MRRPSNSAEADAKGEIGDHEMAANSAFGRRIANNRYKQ